MSTSEPSTKPDISGSGNGNGNGGSTEENDEQDTRNFECNICLSTASDAVISMCGHLFWYVNLATVTQLSLM